VESYQLLLPTSLPNTVFKKVTHFPKIVHYVEQRGYRSWYDELATDWATEESGFFVYQGKKFVCFPTHKKVSNPASNSMFIACSSPGIEVAGS
jgi:hypothetical protein